MGSLKDVRFPSSVRLGGLQNSGLLDLSRQINTWRISTCNGIALHFLRARIFHQFSLRLLHSTRFGCPLRCSGSRLAWPTLSHRCQVLPQPSQGTVRFTPPRESGKDTPHKAKFSVKTGLYQYMSIRNCRKQLKMETSNDPQIPRVQGIMFEHHWVAQGI